MYSQDRHQKEKSQTKITLLLDIPLLPVLFYLFVFTCFALHLKGVYFLNLREFCLLNGLLEGEELEVNHLSHSLAEDESLLLMHEHVHGRV